MNTKLILELLNPKKSEQGFATVLAVGIGLITMIVGLTMVVRSQSSQTNALAQKNTATSVAIAETGMTRTLSELNSKAYSPYLRSSQDPVPLSETTNYLGTNYNQWSSKPEEIGDLCETIETSTSIDALRKKVTIDANKGTAYELLAYVYNKLDIPVLVKDEDGNSITIDDNTYRIGDTKILIRGKKNKGTQDNLASVSNIELTTEVHRRILPASFPGLYASDTIALSGGDILSVESTDSDDANIICGDCNVTASHCDTIANQTTDEAKDTYILQNLMGATSGAVVDGNVYLSAVSMPVLTPPTNECVLSAITQLEQLKSCKITLTSQINSARTLPRATDITALPTSIQSQLTDNSNSYYFNYVFNVTQPDDIKYGGSEVFTIDSGKGGIRLFATGNLTFGGGSSLQHISTNPTTGVVSQGQSERFALIGNVADSNDSNDQNWTMNGGAQTTNMFIYAPDANVQFNGAAGTDPDLFGALWIKNFDNNGNNLQIKVPDDYGQLLGEMYGLDFELGLRIYSTSAPTSWQRKEVN